VLDLSDRVVFRNVHGLLGMAFHPAFPSDRRAYVAYTHETSPGVIMLRVSELMTADNGVTLNPASEQIIFELAQPGGHNNGGHVLFGPDGFLYLGVGDGGNDDDQRHGRARLPRDIRAGLSQSVALELRPRGRSALARRRGLARPRRGRSRW
jgi:glucose/arabinose dehydrogenase